MPKRKRDGDRPRRPRQKQLYLVFDDWTCGYTIRAVDLQSGPSHPSAVSGELAVQRLPPPVLRLMAPRGLPSFFAHGFGTSIISTHPEDSLSPWDGSEDNAIPIFDVRKRSIVYGPPLGFALRPIFFPIGDSDLFALHSDCFELLHRPHRNPRPAKWSWRSLKDPPFTTTDVASYTVHPDGPSILITTEDYLGSVATFTFHTGNSKWKKRGEWALPFTDCAHFDCDLEIFVGPSNIPKTTGHLCFVDKASLNTCNTDEWHAPACNLGRQNLFTDNPGERHVSATLIYLGGESKFCLVECIFKDVRADQVVQEGSKADQVVEEGSKADQVVEEEGKADQVVEEGSKADQVVEEGGKG